MTCSSIFEKTDNAPINTIKEVAEKYMVSMEIELVIIKAKEIYIPKNIRVNKKKFTVFLVKRE